MNSRLHAFEVSRPNLDKVGLDKRMLKPGFTQIVKVQADKGRASEGIPTEVVFDKAWVYLWIVKFVFEKLGVNNAEDFADLFNDCQASFEASKWSEVSKQKEG